MDCAKCNRDLGSPRKTVKCIECGLCYHPYCTRLKTVENYRKLKTELKASWRCDPCCHASRVTKQLAGMAEVIDEVDEVEPSDDDQDLVETSKNMDMEGKIDLLLSSFNKQMKSMKRSMQFFNENFESTQKILKELKNEVTENRKEVDQLVRKNKNLERKVTYLDMKLNDVEQRDLRNDIQISGIPETTGEDVHDEFAVLRLSELTEKTTLVYTYKKYLEGKIERVELGTRSADKITLRALKVKTAAAQRLYLCNGVGLFNKLPGFVTAGLPLAKFKQKIKEYFRKRSRDKGLGSVVVWDNGRYMS
ncbi:hypothetical protein GE061_013730 [Apolygus lucorum]|uniref:PHD-type domain-containing protein n=1 Tax=Apolygus lucorum TaxID=248454 RepID=A0A8S9XNT8_APOLU|nr:hypothetical protein GE061_013730 [Apolygus lucorum]